MAYVALTTTEIAAGKPVSSPVVTKIKDNFISHETRIVSLEGGSATTYPPIIMRVNGTYTNCTYENILKTTTNFNLLVTGVRILIDGCGTSGTTEVNVKYRRGAGAWISLLTTNPSVGFAAGNDSISSNAVLNAANVNLQAGDLIRLDMISAQVGARNFLVRIDYNKT